MLHRFLVRYFLLYTYINDLLEIKCEGSIFCFADDTTISLLNDINKTKLISKAIQIMADINNSNFLEINYNKTCCVRF